MVADHTSTNSNIDNDNHVISPGIGEARQHYVSFFLHNFHRLVTVFCPGHLACRGDAAPVSAMCAMGIQAAINGTETPDEQEPTKRGANLESVFVHVSYIFTVRSGCVFSL